MGKSERYSVAEDLIRLMAAAVGVNCSHKTYFNFKSFLEVYAQLKYNLQYLTYNLPRKGSEDLAPALFEAMISAEVIPKKKVEELIIQLYRKQMIEAQIMKTLSLVKAFYQDGELYYKILDLLYFGETVYSNNEVQRMVGYSRGQYQKRKRQAVMLFGIIFWTEIIKFWENSADEMKEIEDRIGRSNRLSSAHRNEIENPRLILMQSHITENTKNASICR